ncbi:hypothetical protein AGOR_G00052190 [Albula goreensis]|uniref:Uncharacterized protein n=1 Tax=Albula goreensis TaxID=1534307 RepID=A0A8T3DT99_9TELE|nr:hypothetical protein AGOR_G00052190 [Albula goreensis]
MLLGRWKRPLRTMLTAESPPKDGTCGPLTAQGSRCCLQQRPCSSGGFRSQRRLQRKEEEAGAAGGTQSQWEHDRTAGRLQHMIRPATAPGPGRGQLREKSQDPDPTVNSQECSRCSTPCSDKSSRLDGRDGKSTDRRSPDAGVSTSTTLHLYLPSPFDSEDAEKDKGQEEARQLTGQRETTDSKTTPRKRALGNGMMKRTKSMVSKLTSALGNKGKLSTEAQNTEVQNEVPITDMDCMNTAGCTPHPGPALESPLQEVGRQAQIKRQTCRSAPSRPVHWPSRATDNYYEKAVLSKATHHLKLKTTTTFEWGLHGPQESKTVFILQTHSSRPRSSPHRAAATLLGNRGYP